jgi:hypothetical protein
VPNEAVAGAYAELLSREPWQWFATLTFAPRHERAAAGGGVHPEKADKAYRWWCARINESLYGKRWMRVPHGGVVWARGQEFHRSGAIHFHAVLAAPDCDLNERASRYHWHELWYREFGRNQIEQPQSQTDVCGYVSKYVTKDGEVDFSQNFGRAPLPALWERQLVGSGPMKVKPLEQDTRIGRPDRKHHEGNPQRLLLA